MIINIAATGDVTVNVTGDAVINLNTCPTMRETEESVCGSDLRSTEEDDTRIIETVC